MKLGFVEREAPSRQAILSYNILSEINAGNHLARRSFEAMQATEGWYERVTLEAAHEGANPSEGLLNKAFRKGYREVSMRPEYINMQAVQMCGRPHTKIEDMKEQEWNLLGLGDQDSAGRSEREV